MVSDADQRRWKVIATGGLIVRSAKDLASPQAHQRLCFGAEVSPLALEGHRLHFKLLEGEGPDSGWVSVRVAGKICIQCQASDELEADAQLSLDAEGMLRGLCRTSTRQRVCTGMSLCQ